MDSELLRTTALLVTLGASFYLMRRHGGCCTHASTHGAHSHAEGGQTETRDPVCGMAVDPRTAAAQVVHEGRTYSFCSLACRDRFVKQPSRYLSAAHGSCH